MTTICEGLNVIEVGSASAASAMAGMVLADAGARVIKVEPPDGDRLRRSNPSGFRVWNRGKESVVRDLRTPDGQEHYRDLAASADIVIEGFAPGTTEGWGVGADTTCASNPRLVHCRITAFGPAGEYSAIKGYDSVVAARAGLWSRDQFGHRDGAIMYPVPWASFGAAMQAVAGICAALIERERTGRGQQVDATLWAGLEPLDYFVATIAQVMAKKAKAGDPGAGAQPASRYGVLVCTKDGRFIQTSTLLPHQGRALCRAAGIEAILDEARFKNAPMFESPEDAQAFEDALLEAFRTEDLEHWMPRLLESPDVAFEVAVNSEEGTRHPQIVHNGDVVTIEDPEIGAIQQVGPIGHFSATPMKPQQPAPALGQNGGSFEPPGPQERTDPVGPHPLSGITIVEFGYFYAMPYALAVAASLGARVVKIEDGQGDPHRFAFGQELATNKTTAGKESISLDLRSEDGRRIAHEIVRRADIFVTGFRTGIAEKLGLGEQDLRALNERLLYVHAAGYGSDGPYAHRALYAQAAQAVAGSFGRQVGYWSDPDKNLGMSVLELQAVVLPRLGQVIDGDSNAALAVLAAVSLGAYHQARTGEGQRLETSMIAGNAMAYSDDFCTYEGKPSARLCDDENYGTSALDRVYEAADGTWLCLHVPTDAEFDALAGAIGEALRDPQFSDASSRARNDDQLGAALADAFRAKPAAAWQRELTECGVGCAEVAMAGQAATTAFDPVLLESGLTVTIDHPLFGDLVRAAPPVTFSESSGRVALPCFRGEQNRSILSELGYRSEEIDDLEASGVITPPDPRPS